MRSRLSRRGFLKTGLGTAALGRSTAPAARADGGGGVELALEASEEWVGIGRRQALLYAFNGQVPGPLIEARAGDRVHIFFQNRLPEATNLHFHGLHVPSTGNADNVMLRVKPGESIDHDFKIPDDHPSATCWYHPHVHGSAARQVSRGLAGTFIVRNEADAIREIDQAPEAVLIFQDFALDMTGQVLEPSFMERMTGREGPLITTSGSVLPTLSLEQGGWLRLRMVNASSSRFYRLRIEDHAFHIVGSDGGFLPTVIVQDEVLLAPGERVEAMVKGDRYAAEYRLLDLPYNRGAAGMIRRTTGPETLALVRYDGQAASPWRLPEELRSIAPLGQPAVRRAMQLGQTIGPMGDRFMGRGMAFTINGRPFDEGRLDARGALDTIEEWEFINPTAMDHPMHLHTDPFQVIDSSGNPLPAWKDTVLVKAGSRLKVRTALRNYTGLRMFHCHILDHEDLGMMGTLEVHV